jgi:ABC-2 type transport system ATP-binding protein
MTDPFIEISGLVKRFGPFTAVDGLSFSVSKGEVLGFLGPNGAGKSTTMKMITGFLAPTAGHISVCGAAVETQRMAAQAAIGYLPEGAPAYGDMTPRQFLKFIADARGIRGAAAAKAIDAAVERTELDHVMDQQIETLSKGFTRRVGLAQAILHDPKVLIMDEPTDGLDPNQKHSVRDLIAAMAPEKAIIISTHILEEVDAVCSRALIIDRGRIVADGTPDDLIARSRFHNAVTVVVGQRDVDAMRAGLKGLAPVGEIEESARDSTVKMTIFPKVHDDIVVDDVSELVTRNSWDVRALYAEAGRLDQVFRSLTTADTTEEHPGAAKGRAKAQAGEASFE